ncbi:MAG: PaaX family transcriptional regulator [Streptosporangiales bacterium]|nr:PaaX family transcriptional regulator [Streptosporangiales bacterium]
MVTTTRDTGPRMSRRHAAGEPSARGLLLTVLGEFVLPRAEPVWTATLIGLLDRLGVEEKSARQALARTAADGWLSSERVGRSVRWSLTEPGRRLLTEGRDRIYSLGARAPEWDGVWLIVYVTVPEARRSLRHRLRTRLTWAGFGSPEPGMWISPFPAQEAEAAAAVAELGLGEQAMSFTARFAGIGAERDMVARAWDLTAIAEEYAEFIDAFGAPLPDAPDAVLLAQARLVHRWRRFPFADPRLPAELLPKEWIGDRAARLFHARHDAWHERAQARFAELAADAP